MAVCAVLLQQAGASAALAFFLYGVELLDLVGKNAVAPLKLSELKLP
jgi:hypothetical protein